MCASCLTSKLLVYIKAHHHNYVFSIDFTSCESNWSSRWAIGTSLLARREFKNPKENSCKQPSYASQINNITNLNDNTVHMCFLNYYSLKVPVDGTLGREWRREFTLAHNTGGPWKPLTTQKYPNFGLHQRLEETESANAWQMTLNRKLAIFQNLSPLKAESKSPGRYDRGPGGPLKGPPLPSLPWFFSLERTIK